MEQLIYRIALFVTGIINLLMAGKLLKGSMPYKQYAVYFRTRMLTALWVGVFGLGYILHGVLMWRYTWPTAASALTVTYFHIGAICFSWGYTTLLNPNYLTPRIVLRDGIYYLACLLLYWMVALLWKEQPAFTLLSYCLYFIYAVWIVFKFYKLVNKCKTLISQDILPSEMNLVPITNIHLFSGKWLTTNIYLQVDNKEIVNDTSQPIRQSKLCL